MIVSYEPLPTTYFLTDYQLQHYNTYGSIEVDLSVMDFKECSYRDTGYEMIDFCKLLDVEYVTWQPRMGRKVYASFDIELLFIEHMTETYLLYVSSDEERAFIMKRLKDYKTEIVGEDKYIRVYKRKHGHRYISNRRKITYKALRNIRMCYIRKVLKGWRKG